MIRVGIIGCGAFARVQHLPNCVNHPGVELTWACDLSVDRLRFIEETYHPLHVTSDSADVFRAPDVDMVILSVPHSLHERMILEAAAAGKHILCEKPMATTNEESYRIVRAVRKTGVKLCVDYNRRFAPALLDLKAAYLAHRKNPKPTPWKFVQDPDRPLLPEEEASMLLIRVQDESSTYRMVHLDPFMGCGEIIGESCHYLDLCCFLMDRLPVRVFATGSSRLNHIITLDFADGSLAAVFFGATGTFDYPKQLYEIQDHGAYFQSHYYVENQYYGLGKPVRKTFALQYDDFPDIGTEGGIAGYLSKVRARAETYAASGKTDYRTISPNIGYVQLLDAFVNAIVEDRPSPVDERVGARATYLATRAVESVRSGSPLPIRTEDMDFCLHVQP